MTIYRAFFDPVEKRRELRRPGRPDLGLDGNVLVPGVPDPEPVTPTVGAARFAGHVPGRPLIGIAAPEDGPGNPGWTQARSLIGQPIYEARRFKPERYTASVLNGMLDDATAANAYPVVSLKYPDWQGVVNGTFDVELGQMLDHLWTWANASSGRTVGFAIHHEPAGDGPLATWALMQRKLSWMTAGRRGGLRTSAYVAAQDYRSKVALHAIGNGFWWRTGIAPNVTDDANVAFPAALIADFTDNQAVVSADTYDCDYVNQQGALTDVNLRTPGSGVRTNVRLANMAQWARNRDVPVLGIGELGCIDGAEIDRCTAVIDANRDLFGVVNYFASDVNSDHDWRLVPASFPVKSGRVSSKGLVDFGGNVQSEGRLAAFRRMLTKFAPAAV